MTFPPRRWFGIPSRQRHVIAAEVDDELSYHLERRSRDLQALGLAPDVARARARQEFGDLERTRQYCVEQDLTGQNRRRWRDRLEAFAQDTRIAWRRLIHRPGLVITGVGTLAIGIGATIAFWTVANQLVLNPFHFPDGARFGYLARALPGSRLMFPPSAADVAQWRSARSFDRIEPIAVGQATLIADDAAELVQIRRITEGLLHLTDAQPLLGRGFTEDDRVPGAPPVMMLGYDLWRTRFGRDPRVLGRAITLDSTSYRVVGVMPRLFESIPGVVRVRSGQDLVALPLPTDTSQAGSVNALFRLAPGVTLARARVELALLDAQAPSTDGIRHVTSVVGAQELVGDTNTRILFLLLGAVGLLLLIACANVAHLLLNRTISLQGEQAVRQALGASRARLLQNGLIDALVIGLLGSGLGLLLAGPILKGLNAFRPPSLDSLSAVALSPSAVWPALGLGLVVALLSGLLPAWRGASADPSALLQGVRSIGRRGERRLRGALLVTEIGLSLMLVVGAGLMVRSLQRLGAVPIGFDPDAVLATRVELPQWRYRDPAVTEDFFTRLAEAMRAVPGISAVTRSTGLPPITGIATGNLAIAGRDLPDAETERLFSYQAVPADYFQAMGISLREGRAFDPRFSDGEPGVVMVNEFLARRYWPRGGAIGQRIRVGSGGTFDEIVGVVPDVPAMGVGEALGRSQLYYPLTPKSGARVIVMRTALPVGAVQDQLRAAMRRIDQTIPVPSVARVRRELDKSMASKRFTEVLLIGFAAFASLLFAAGLFGVLSQVVALRTREIGIRVALGASPGGVQCFILRQGLGPVAIGIAVGLTGAWWGAQLMASLVFGISIHDSATFAGAATATLLVAMLASWLPARRAARLAPAEVLRE